MTTPAFVHLQVHSEYSLKDGLIRIERPEPIADDAKKRHLEPRFMTLAERAAELKLPALALTDTQNLFAAIKFYKSCESRGIKPLIGVEVTLAERQAGEPPESVTLLAQDARGYRSLLDRVSQAYVQGQARGQPLLARDALLRGSEGLIVLCGPRSEIGRALLTDRLEDAQACAREWMRAFGDRLYLAVARCGRPDDERHVQASVALARQLGIPVVACNEARFLRREDFQAYQARACIAQGRTLDDSKRDQEVTVEQHLKSAEEMAALFHDLPEAVENTVEIAKRCNLSLTLGKTHLPDFPVPTGTTVPQFLKTEAQRGLVARLKAHPPAQGQSETSYRERLDYELGVIEKMGFAGYFLVVADFIRWAKSNSVPVGPGRGSGAGSLVAYALGITDLDPIPYDLLFERFLNPERVSLPDFDVDFCMWGRDRVIEYVTQKYGRDHVGQIITYGSMAARAVVRDVARVLGQPYAVGDRIAKMIPGGPTGLTLGEALDQVPELQQARKHDEEVAAVIELALPLEGLVRNAGIHAGGVVIAPRPLTEFTPLYCEAGGIGVRSQFDMKDLETVGLVKFDFLGLRTLTILQLAVDRINAARAPDTPALDLLRLALDDAPTYALYASGHTTAVFQMESGGMQRASVDLKPDHFEDLIALISLFRPGPMDNIPEYVARKHGRARISYLHPGMKEVLQPTYGFFVYQEQVMQVAQRLAGYTLAGADLLRRAMGKKIAREMAQQRSIFIEGAQKNGLTESVATAIFDEMEKFANYGFNKSHAAAYALVSYQTAWLKAHHPAEFMAAVLSCEMGDTDTVVLMLEECRRLGLSVLPPDLNRSQMQFTAVADARQIVYGLAAIKGAGEGALAGVLEERARGGPFTDLFDLCRRIDTHKTNKRVLEALIHSGALDGFGVNRPTLARQLPVAMQAASQAAEAASQVDLFGTRTTATIPQAGQAPEPDWPDLERLRHEKNALGFYLSGHPIESYRELIAQIAGGSLKKAIESAPPVDPQGGFARRGASQWVAGWLVEVRRFSGGRRAVLTLDDKTARLSVPLNEELLGRISLPRTDTLWFINGRVSADTYTGGWQIYPNELLDLDAARQRCAERLELDWPRGRSLDAAALESLLAPARSAQGCPVSVQYVNGASRATLDLDADWRVALREEALQALRKQLGERNVRVVYRRLATPAPPSSYES